jgi:outer membrane murein-binding lipoprotein Lpp
MKNTLIAIAIASTFSASVFANDMEVHFNGGQAQSNCQQFLNSNNLSGKAQCHQSGGNSGGGVSQGQVNSIQATANQNKADISTLNSKVTSLTNEVRGRDAATNDRIDALTQEIIEVDREDISVKSGEIVGSELVLRVEDHAKSRGRDEIYGKDVRIDVSSLQGQDGADGVDGATGAKGDTGATGATGDTGATGAKGNTGATGSTGATGAKGEKGENGNTGAAGATGAKGEKGNKGDQGNTGAKGEKGNKGDQGNTGATGAKGDKGDQGIQGIQGVAGRDGMDVDPAEVRRLDRQDAALAVGIDRNANAIRTLDSKVDYLASELSAGVAAAMSATHAIRHTDGARMGVAYYNNEAAVTFGARKDDKTFTFSFDSRKTASFGFGMDLN